MDRWVAFQTGERPRAVPLARGSKPGGPGPLRSHAGACAWRGARLDAGRARQSQGGGGACLLRATHGGRAVPCESGLSQQGRPVEGQCGSPASRPASSGGWQGWQQVRRAATGGAERRAPAQQVCVQGGQMGGIAAPPGRSGSDSMRPHAACAAASSEGARRGHWGRRLGMLGKEVWGAGGARRGWRTSRQGAKPRGGCSRRSRRGSSGSAGPTILPRQQRQRGAGPSAERGGG
jgi:hypothetical protein